MAKTLLEIPIQNPDWEIAFDSRKNQFRLKQKIPSSIGIEIDAPEFQTPPIQLKVVHTFLLEAGLVEQLAEWLSQNPV